MKTIKELLKDLDLFLDDLDRINDNEDTESIYQEIRKQREELSDLIK